MAVGSTRAVDNTQAEDSTEAVDSSLSYYIQPWPLVDIRRIEPKQIIMNNIVSLRDLRCLDLRKTAYKESSNESR